MPIIQLSEIQDAHELEHRAQADLEGRRLSDIYNLIIQQDSTSRVKSKAGVGDVIEQGYFGLARNNTAGPDIPHLGVEVKTSPLRRRKDGTLTSKEPLSLNIINYAEEARRGDFEESSLFKKNRKILFIFYIHEESLLRSDYLIKYVFLWEISGSVISELRPDYDLIVEKIRAGEAHHIHQYQHKYLTLCPKHGGKFKDPSDTKSKTAQPYSAHPAEVRGFRLKSSYMNLIIQRYLADKRPSEQIYFAQKPSTDKKR